MQISIEIPDDLDRLSNAEAALHRLTAGLLIEVGLWLPVLVRR
jgi:hypothetical protein